MKKPTTHILGYPRIGEKRELKKATEAYWQGKLTRAELEETGRALRRRNWLVQQAAGIDLIPSNDFSFYDQMLDLSCLVGNVPPRFGWRGGEVDLDTRFAIARGVRPKAEPHVTAAACRCADCQPDAATHASEMTKWFDTNYHYIVPEFRADTAFSLSSSKIFDEFSEALALGIKTKPVLPGPVTYLKLGKVHDPANPSFNRLELLPRLLPVYIQVLQKLEKLGAEWVQLDEPVYALDLGEDERACLMTACATLAAAAPGLKILVASYFGGLRNNLPHFLRLPVSALHVDVVRAPDEIDTVLQEFDGKKLLSLGLVDGRNIWRTDFAAVRPQLEKAVALFGPERLLLAPSCSLQHVPVTLRNEGKIDAGLKNWLAFAEEKLAEVAALRDIAAGTVSPEILTANAAAAASRRASPLIHRPEVKDRVARVTASDLVRASPFAQRQIRQRARLRLPAFPTTTIGSFPQTDTVRAVRAKWRKGDLEDADYEKFLEDETLACVRFQEEIGLDMLVHGEFERNDMVEYFGEQLDGFAFTQNGWVQSYGSRCVKPPVIYGDVARPKPMTVRWSSYAQSLTQKPVKGMLTGPVTILQWSFVRNDQPRRRTAFQIALALRDEVLDLEKAGITAIQIDEPAIREGLPLRRDDWKHYLAWAVDAFHLSAAGARDDTQIHTHMCYSEFNDIIDAIAALDADVITIETSRSNMELLEAFVHFKYPNEIGPGVYDIHSPRVPAVAEMTDLLRKAAAVLPTENLWVNPDCGLKTRGWTEVKSSLINMVAAALELRGAIRPAVSGIRAAPRCPL
ncbi:MAG: 5-methyltetrahydropteroyltriglutamate--homocysteine S-methyltransferase [Puniceicoccales bacterium]|jgi:5-methyltetrahydropteroyltriglutamate--homocysteine methyltransferase|nr:5-methyltetrahydropteroyltriglutamate--homocysteine S-methyltransferase [Puniceicoccales bacterium]